MKKFLLTIICTVLTSMAYAVEVPVGYSKGQIAGSSSYVLNGKGSISVAERVSPELIASFVGNEIRGLSVGIIDSKYCDSIRVFVRPSLDGEDIATGLITKKDTDASKRPKNGWNNAALDNPVAIVEGQELFIGFIFYQRYKCEAVSFVGSADANRTYVKRGTGNWEDASEKGYPSLEMLIDGDNMPQFDFRVDAAEGMLVSEGTLSTNVTITNNGQVVPSSFDLTFTAQGYSYVETVTTPIATATSETVNVILNGVPSEVGFDFPLTVAVTRLEGGEDINPSDNSHGVGVKVKRNIVVEEFTGTGCGWCPRGIIGMEKLRNTYGDRFVGIAVHQYNTSDPMYPSHYKNLGWTGAPSCVIDRRLVDVDPYYGTDNVDICHDVDAEMAAGAMAAVTVTGSYNEDKSAVNAAATINAQSDFSGLKLTFVLTADSLTGTTSAWKQSNYYTSYSASQLPEDLAIFGAGGEYGTSTFFWVFNDVAIGSYYENGQYEMGLNPIEQGGSLKVDYTLTMPTKQILVDALKYDYVAVVAMLLDGSGKVINAGKYYLGGVDPTGITDAMTESAEVKEVARYTIDGRMISTPQPGINIVKLSNGKSFKIMVK